MPYFRRMPKFGFSNAGFREHFWIVNLREIVTHPAFSSGGEVTPESLIDAGLIRDDSRSVKVLGDVAEADSLAVKLDVRVHRVSRAAKKLIEDAGGSVEEAGTRRVRVRRRPPRSTVFTPTTLSRRRRPGRAKKNRKK